MTLPITTETVHTVDYGDLEQYIREEFGQEFSVPADLESSNDTDHRMIVDGRLSDYDRGQIQKFRETGSHYFLTEVILNMLCVNNKIPAGTYLISVYW